MFFEDRTDAGKKLLPEITKLGLKDPVVIALPRGGVVVAKQIADGLRAPLDILLVRKLGTPFNPELAVGAIVEGEPPFIHINQDLKKILKVTDDYLKTEEKMQLQVIARQSATYRKGRTRSSVKDKAVILVDDGVATGATIYAAIKALLSQKPSRFVVAFPVAPPDTVKEISKEVKEVVCLSTPADFQAVGQFFRNFAEVTDAEVVELLSTK
jgi:putative phosphoribosyl transferase